MSVLTVVRSTFSLAWERWSDPGPALCGAGVRRPSYSYVAAIEGECVIEWDAATTPSLAQLEELAQDECPYAQVIRWGIVVCDHQRRATLTVEEFDEDTVSSFDDDGYDADRAYDEWRDKQLED